MVRLLFTFFTYARVGGEGVRVGGCVGGGGCEGGEGARSS
jgi:hypothetical protein